MQEHAGHAEDPAAAAGSPVDGRADRADRRQPKLRQPGHRPRTRAGRAAGPSASPRSAGAVVVGVLAVGFAIGSGTSTDSAAGAPSAERQPARVAEAGLDLAGRADPGAPRRARRARVRRRDRATTPSRSPPSTARSCRSRPRTAGLGRSTPAGATVTKGGATVALSTLKVGDQIVFRETRNDDGTYTITAITVVQPTVGGTVASVSGSTVTVTTLDGGHRRRSPSPESTTYTLGGQAATKDAVVAGARIGASGTLGQRRHAHGDVRRRSSRPRLPARSRRRAPSSLTLTMRDGSTLTVKVTSSTTYQVDGIASPTLADIKVGDVVMASGTKNADGSLSATVVRSHAAGDFGGPGMGWLRPRRAWRRRRRLGLPRRPRPPGMPRTPLRRRPPPRAGPTADAGHDARGR